MGYGGRGFVFTGLSLCRASRICRAIWRRSTACWPQSNRRRLRLDDISSGPGQLKALVDLCHVYGIAVVFDVVYNHAGGFTVDGQLRRQLPLLLRSRSECRQQQRQPLFHRSGSRHRRPRVRALERRRLRNFCSTTRRTFSEEFHADGFRYDEISILLSTNQGSGWEFCRALTTKLRGFNDRILQNAEFWPGEFSDIPFNGAAGDRSCKHRRPRASTWCSTIICAASLRSAVQAASRGADAPVSVSAIAAALYPPGFDHAWRAVTCIENHDLVLTGRSPRIPVLADSSNPRSWYARSRSRVATALLLTAPGIPQLFMGQEFLEDKPWDVTAERSEPVVVGGFSVPIGRWAIICASRSDLIRLRRNLPALRGDNVHAFYQSDADRVLAYHRWLEGTGQDVIVVASFAESTRQGYNLGFPAAGFWAEVFNSDVYDHWVNPWVAGNGGGIHADGKPLHGFAASASIVIPANSVVVFTRGPAN